jgi:hypothetical protein
LIELVIVGAIKVEGCRVTEALGIVVVEVVLAVVVDLNRPPSLSSSSSPKSPPFPNKLLLGGADFDGSGADCGSDVLVVVAIDEIGLEGKEEEGRAGAGFSS